MLIFRGVNKLSFQKTPHAPHSTLQTNPSSIQGPGNTAVCHHIFVVVDDARSTCFPRLHSRGHESRSQRYNAQTTVDV